MPETDLILRVRPRGVENLRNRFRAVFGGLRGDISRFNTQLARAQLDRIQSTSKAEKENIKRIIAGMRLQKTQLRGLERGAAGFAKALSRAKVAALAIGAVGLFLVARQLKRALSAGIDLNAQFEAMRVGVAATLAATSKITDAQGRQLTGVQAVVEAQKRSASVQRELLNITLQTGGTLDVTLQAFRVALPLVGRIGGSLEDTLDIVKRLNLAAIAIGIPIELVRQQIDDLLKGIITQRTLLGLVLGIQQEQLRAAREQGRLLEFLREKTQPFLDAQDILLGKFNAIKNRVIALGQEFGRLATAGGFLVLKRALSDLIERVALFDKRTGEFQGFKPEAKATIDRLRGSVTDLTIALRDSVGVANRLLITVDRFGEAREKIRGLFPGGTGPFGGGPRDLRRGDLKKEVAKRLEELNELFRLSALQPLIAPRFPDIKGNELVRAAKRLADLKIALQEARKEAAQFPQRFLEAKTAVDEFTERLGPQNTAKVKELSDAIAKSRTSLVASLAKARKEFFSQSKVIRIHTFVLERAIKRQLELNAAIKGLEGISKKVDKPLSKIDDRLVSLGVGTNALAGSVQKLGELLDKSIREQTRKAFDELAEDIGSSFSRIFGEILAGTRSFAASLRTILRSIVNAIIGTFIQRLVTAAFKSIFAKLAQAVAGTIKKGGILGKILGIILGVDPKSVKATKDNTKATKVNTTSTDDNTAAIRANTAAIQASGQGGGTTGNPFLARGIGRILGRLPGRKLTGAAGAAQGIAGLVGPALLLSSLTRGGRLGTATGIAGGALTGFAFGGPIGAAVGAVAGGFLAGILGAARRREAKRLKLVQAAIERQLVSLPQRKLFQFANAPSIEGILGSTFLQRPGGFSVVPRAAGFSTGMTATVINISPRIELRVDALDAESLERRGPDIARAISGEVSEMLHGQLNRTGRISSRILEISEPV